jgi:hypothetical protein
MLNRIVRTDEAIQYNQNENKLYLLKYHKNGEFSAEEITLTASLNEVIFPEVTGCHIVAAYDAQSKRFWFAHVSIFQADSMENPFQPQAITPPPYSQLLSDNYPNNKNIGINKKDCKHIKFIIIDNKETFNETNFYTIYGEVACTLCRPPVKRGEYKSEISISFNLISGDITFTPDPNSISTFAPFEKPSKIEGVIQFNENNDSDLKPRW